MTAPKRLAAEAIWIEGKHNQTSPEVLPWQAPRPPARAQRRPLRAL